MRFVEVSAGNDKTNELGQAVGLGLELDLDAVRQYLLDVEIEIGGRVLYRTPDLVP